MSLERLNQGRSDTGARNAIGRRCQPLSRGWQSRRLWLRSAFFALFVLAPPLDLFRLDLTLGHFILFGMDWTLGLEAYQRGEIGTAQATLNLILRGFLPIALVAGAGIGVAWRWGRLYCGWLCPHFSVVEVINALMLRASGSPTLWEYFASRGRHRAGAQRGHGQTVSGMHGVTQAGGEKPEQALESQRRRPLPVYWLGVIFAVLGFAFLWAISLLTYLFPPAQVYPDLWQGDLPRAQAIFLGVATALLAIEFLFARHLFCRFACAAGLFQSLAWMGNRRAMVVRFERDLVENCLDCTAACDNACPMRLKPRAIKRRMFTCTQCARCIQSCDQVMQDKPQSGLLSWVAGDEALDVSSREFGRERKEVR